MICIDVFAKTSFKFSLKEGWKKGWKKGQREGLLSSFFQPYFKLLSTFFQGCFRHAVVDLTTSLARPFVSIDSICINFASHRSDRISDLCRPFSHCVFLVNSLLVMPSTPLDRTTWNSRFKFPSTIFSETFSIAKLTFRRVSQFDSLTAKSTSCRWTWSDSRHLEQENSNASLLVISPVPDHNAALTADSPFLRLLISSSCSWYLSLASGVYGTT